MNNNDEEKLNVIWYIFYTIGTWFGVINIIRYFKVNKEISKLKNEIMKLQNDLIGKEEVIIRQQEYIKQLESNDK